MNKQLGIVLPNNFVINPVVLDCCLGVDGYGPPGLFKPTYNKKINRRQSTTVLKSITRFEKVGNFGAPIWWPNGWSMTQYGFPLPKKFCYTPIGGGSTTNSFGLTNDGFDDFMYNVVFCDEFIIPSIFLEFGTGSDEDLLKAELAAIYMGQALKENHFIGKSGGINKLSRVIAVILNVSCPNDANGVCLISNEKIAKVIKAFKDSIGDIPIGVKYSYMQDISLAVTINREVDIAFHQAINTIPFRALFGYKKFSPLSHIGHGGVSGPAITQKALEYVKKLRTALGPDVKIIGGGGISNLNDAIERVKWCDAIAMGILVNKNTDEANKIIDYFA